MAHQVFISYAMDDDDPMAEKVCHVLESRGIKCWYARRDSTGNFAEEIIVAIREAEIFLLLMSESASKSKFIPMELNAATSENKHIIGFRLDKLEPGDSIKLLVIHLAWIDAFSGDIENHYTTLVGRVYEKLGLPAPNEYEKQRPARSAKPALVGGIIAIVLLLLGFVLGQWTKGQGPPGLPGSDNTQIAEPVYSDVFYQNCDDFLRDMPRLKWVIYDPVGYDPYTNQEPTLESIQRDIQVLRENGFNGLITMTSQGNHRYIPGIADQEGFQRIIVGVYYLNNEDEINNALSVSLQADAYCLGSEGLYEYYTPDELKAAIILFRLETEKPVTTSENISTCTSQPFLAELGDFFFPVAYPYWHFGKTPDEAWAETLQYSVTGASLVSGVVGSQVLLKQVSYPSGGISGLSEENQRIFFNLALTGPRYNPAWPGNVSISFMCAFDPVWKTEEYGWTPPEKYTGLFTSDREPKAAITQLGWGE